MLTRCGVRLFVKRDDLTHPEVMGNKWRKLKYNMLEAKQSGKRIATYGGAYSNHLAATAAAGRLMGVETLGVVRGQELRADANDTLRAAEINGMKLSFVSREDFRLMKTALYLPFPSTREDTLILPEGGTNDAAIRGASEIISEIESEDFDVIATAVGTGGTMAGLIKGLQGKKQVWGFSALKGPWQEELMRQLLEHNQIPFQNYSVFEDTFGGYARYDDRLLKFMVDFTEEHRIVLDPIYTAKAFFGLFSFLDANVVKRGTKICMIHSGGLQGIEGFNKSHKLSLPTMHTRFI